MNFKEFFEQEEKADYYSNLVGMHIKPKHIRKFFKDNPSTLSNFTDENGKITNAVNTVTVDLKPDLKNGTTTVLTPKWSAITYDKNGDPIFGKNTKRKSYPIDRQKSLDILLQPFGGQQQSKLGGGIA